MKDTQELTTANVNMTREDVEEAMVGHALPVISRRNLHILIADMRGGAAACPLPARKQVKSATRTVRNKNSLKICTETVLYIGGLPKEVRAMDLDKLFSPFGKLKSTEVVKDPFLK